MHSKQSKIDKPFLAIFSSLLLIAVVSSIILFPEWRQSFATVILLVVAATVGVVGFASTFRSAFMPDNKEAKPVALEYDTPQHQLNHENVTSLVRTAINSVLGEALPERVRIELALDSPLGMLRGHTILVEGLVVRHPPAHTTDIAVIFKDSGRRLLILGAPGSGKTITLYELCQSLLPKAENDPREPVPVVLNLSTWAQKQGRLEDWLIEEMSRHYRLSKKVTPIWLDADHLYLLLDGLDEVRLDARDACIRAINAFGEIHGEGLAVCSRSADYAELSERLALSRAVEIQPLDPAKVDEYLTNDRLRLSAVREAIASDDPLRELSTTPLMLNVMALAV